jgi:hypothetical protein
MTGFGLWRWSVESGVTIGSVMDFITCDNALKV